MKAGHADGRIVMAQSPRDVPQPTAVAGETPTLCAPTLITPTAQPQGWVHIPGYDILAELGRGGMGVVCKARQIKANRIVALKIILNGQFASETDVRRFREEAEAVAHLDHPNIVPLYEVGEHAGQHYFTTKFIEGGSLATCGCLSPQKAARLVARVAHAVHHAHARGILHRDLKPANILIDELGKPHVTDFGLPRRVHNEPEASAAGLTQTGVLVGTPSYMAPEQAAAKKDLTTAVDVWSLGAILYECLTGQPPFRGATAIDTLRQVTEQEPVRPRAINPDIPRDLETVCLKCLEKDPARRYDGAEELARDLERWLAGEPIQARPVGLSERAVKWARRRPAAAALVIVSAVALLSLLLFAGALWHNAEQRALAREELDYARKQTTAARTEVNRIRAEARYLEDNIFRARDKARRIRYAADMHSAHAAWEANNVPRMASLLERYAPAEELGGKSLQVPHLEGIDPRGFEWRYLWHLCHGEQRGWLAHRPPASAPGAPASHSVLVAFSPDGKTLVSASLDEPLQLWDQTTGRLLRTLSKPSGPVLSLAFSADGKSLEVVTADPSRSAVAPHDPKRFRDVFDGKTKPSLENLALTLRWQSISLLGESGPATPLSFDRLTAPATAMVGMPGAVSAMRAGQTVVKGGVLIPLSLAASPDHKLLAIGGLFTDGKAPAKEGALLLWDLAANQEKGLARNLAPVSTLAFARDGQTLVAGDFDGEVSVWDLARWPEPPRARLKGHSALVLSLAFSADGQSLASGGGDALVIVRETKTGRVQATCKGHRESVSSVAFSSKERLLASASLDGAIKLWDPAALPGPRTVEGFRSTLLTAAFSQDGTTLTLVDRSGLLRVVDAETGRERSRLDMRQSLKIDTPGPGIATSAALSPDRKTVALGTSTHGLVLYDVATGKETSRVNMPAGAIRALAFSPNGTTLAVGIGEGPETGQIKLFHPGPDKEPSVLRGHTKGVINLAFSPDGTRLASVSLDGTARLWDAIALKEKHLFPTQDAVLWCVAFSSDSRRVAIAAGDQVTIHEADSASAVLTLRGHHHQVAAMAFSPDDRRLATAGGDGDSRRGGPLNLWGRGGGVKLWDLATGQEVLTLGGATDVLSCVAFSRDGRRLAAGRTFGSPFAGINDGGEVRIWEAPPLDRQAAK
jgi:WD40 repeat protein/tRNA A-37 threonylcarbamoyl transferase component Bud32